MSSETWLKEFYPVAAGSVAARASDVTLLEHSIVKWRGALPAALKRHGLKQPPIDFNSDSCALCERYAVGSGCEGCPLYEYRGGFSCSHRKPSEPAAPFSDWLMRDNPRPMLALLRAALRKARSK